MKVSVIITTYCHSSLARAVESVLEQTYLNWELIIVNDCPGYSNLKTYQDKRIKYIHNAKNFGGAKSLNIGLAEAQGQYIAILDDDDFWISQDKLARQVEFLNQNQDYIAVGAETLGAHVSGKISLGDMPFAHSSLMFRKGLKYNENLARGKDLDLILRLKKLGKIGIIKDCFIHYTVSHDLQKKITDCSYHRKVIWLHRKDYPLWFFSYLKVFWRECRLQYYRKIKNPLLRLKK